MPLLIDSRFTGEFTLLPCSGTAFCGNRKAFRSEPLMKFHEQPVKGAYLIAPERIVDGRGHFARIFCERELAQHGLVARVVQVNTGFSPRVGTLRGLHYQVAPHEEVKIVRCVRGAVFDVMVDMRPGSPTYLTWCAATLTADNGLQFYVPAGCAHGYQSLAPDTELVYSTSEPYAPAAAHGIRYDDPLLAVDWPLPVQVISAADSAWPYLSAEAETPSTSLHQVHTP